MSEHFATGTHGRLLELKQGGFNPLRILDIGANMGQFCTLTRRVWPEAHVTSIEAVDDCAPWLHLTADEYHIALLSDSERDVDFWVSEHNPASQGNSYYRETLESFPHNVRRSMRTTTLDTLLAGKEPFDFVKLDTQGSERDIIRGGRATIAPARFVLCEMQCGVASNEGAPSRVEVEQELASLGFGDGIMLEWWTLTEGDRRINEDWIYRRL